MPGPAGSSFETPRFARLLRMRSMSWSERLEIDAGMWFAMFGEKSVELDIFLPAAD
jgi:hypothetical protein